MKYSYDDYLNLLKKSFTGSEESIWVDEVRNHFPRQDLQVLDIGIGTGESINKKVRRLAQDGYNIRVHGIDPYVSIDTVKRNVSVPIEISPMRFEEYTTDQTFHIINATHSLYYLDGLGESLQKMVTMLRKDGLLLITHWSQACVLYQLHMAVFTREIKAFTAEEVYSKLLSENCISDIRYIKHEEGVNLWQWQESSSMLNAALEVIARKAKYDMNDESKKQKLLDALEELSPTEIRTNWMIIATK